MDKIRCEIYREHKDSKDPYMIHYIPTYIIPQNKEPIELYNVESGNYDVVEVIKRVLGFKEDEPYVKIYVL